MPKLVNDKHAGGRPPVEIDLKKVELLAQLYATDTEIAISLGVSRNSVKRVKKKKAYQEAIERGKVRAALGVRKAQFDAVLAGDRTMLVWMGKQILGQSENSFGLHSDPFTEIKLTVKRPKPPSVT